MFRYVKTANEFGTKPLRSHTGPGLMLSNRKLRVSYIQSPQVSSAWIRKPDGAYCKSAFWAISDTNSTKSPYPVFLTIPKLAK